MHFSQTSGSVGEVLLKCQWGVEVLADSQLTGYLEYIYVTV